VSKSKHHLTATNKQNVYKENTDRCVNNRETLDCKECGARVCSAPAHDVQKLHILKDAAHTKNKHHARQHDNDSKRTELNTRKTGQVKEKVPKA
jgi:hypothetical protein